MLRNAITIVTDLINLMAANITNTVALIKAVITGDWDEAWRLAGQIVTDNAGFITHVPDAAGQCDDYRQCGAGGGKEILWGCGDVPGGLGLDNPFEGLQGRSMR